MPSLTRAQSAALTWLTSHGGDAVMDFASRALARGEIAPVRADVWVSLFRLGRIAFHGKGNRRIRLTSPHSVAAPIDCRGTRHVAPTPTLDDLA